MADATRIDRARSSWPSDASRADSVRFDDPLGLLPKPRKEDWNALRIILASFGMVFALVFIPFVMRYPIRERVVPLFVLAALGSLVWLIVEWNRRHAQDETSRPAKQDIRRQIGQLRIAMVLLGVPSFFLFFFWLLLARDPVLLWVSIVGIGITIDVHRRMLWNRRRLRIPWVEPIRMKMTRFGFGHILLTLGLGLVALQTGINLLIGLFAVTITLIVVSGILAQGNLRRLTAKRTLPEEVVAGSPIPTTLIIRNDKRWLPSFSLWVQDGLPEGTAIIPGQPVPRMPAGFALFVPRSGEVKVAGTLLLPRRGPVRMAGISIMTRFPFGMFGRYRYIRQPDEILVLPRHDRQLPRLHGQSRERSDEGGHTRERLGDGDIAALRPYRPAEDEVRSIHWRTTARVGEPIVRERERMRSGVRTILLERGTAGDEWESAIERAATLVHRAHRDGVPYMLRIAPPIPADAPKTSDDAIAEAELAATPGTTAAHRLAALRTLARVQGLPRPDTEAGDADSPAGTLSRRAAEQWLETLAALPTERWNLPLSSSAYMVTSDRRPEWQAYIEAHLPAGTPTYRIE